MYNQSWQIPFTKQLWIKLKFKLALYGSSFSVLLYSHLYSSTTWEKHIISPPSNKPIRNLYFKTVLISQCFKMRPLLDIYNIFNNKRNKLYNKFSMKQTHQLIHTNESHLIQWPFNNFSKTSSHYKDNYFPLYPSMLEWYSCQSLELIKAFLQLSATLTFTLEFTREEFTRYLTREVSGS